MSDHEEFLNGTMVNDGDILVLLDAGVFREPEETGFQRTVFQIRVGLPDQRAKTWTMNKTTRNRLANAWGDESTAWVDKRVRVQILQQNVRGEVKKVIYGHPVEAPPSQPKLETPASTPTEAPPTGLPQALPTSTPPAPPVSQESLDWIIANQAIIGQKISPEVYNSTVGNGIIEELYEKGYIKVVDEYPWLGEKTRELL